MGRNDMVWNGRPQFSTTASGATSHDHTPHAVSQCRENRLARRGPDAIRTRVEHREDVGKTTDAARRLDSDGGPDPAAQQAYVVDGCSAAGMKSRRGLDERGAGVAGDAARQKLFAFGERCGFEND